MNESLAYKNGMCYTDLVSRIFLFSQSIYAHLLISLEPLAYIYQIIIGKMFSMKEDFAYGK